MTSSITRHTLPMMGRPYRLRVPSHTHIATVRCSPQRQPMSPTASSQRPLSQSPRFSYPRKDSQDKDSINTEATEYSKSATDDEGARQQDAAFDPNITDPQKQKDKAGEGLEGTVSNHDTNNPLDVSPANPEVSKQRGETEGGAENSSASSNGVSDRQRSSGGGGPRKGSKVA